MRRIPLFILPAMILNPEAVLGLMGAVLLGVLLWEIGATPSIR